jgi:hypothetical protein
VAALQGAVLHCSVLPTWPSLRDCNAATAHSELLFFIAQQLHIAHSGTPCAFPSTSELAAFFYASNLYNYLLVSGHL